MNREQFIECVEREQERLRRFLLALCCGNRDEADDIAQESLIKAYLAMDKYCDEGKFRSWLFKIAHHTFLDKRRGAYLLDSIDESMIISEGVKGADDAFEYQDLYVAIAALPVKERTSILLFYMEGYSVKEIAKIVGCSAMAVRKQLSRGREQLKLKLKR